jgi:RHS repeat-associated protein
MSRTSRNLILLLMLVLGLSARAFATATATITVGGSEQQVSGVSDTKSITVSFNGYTETVSPGQFSTTASIASAIAAQFSRDYAHAGLSTQVVCGTSSNLITFKLGGTATFGTLSVTGSTTSFQMSAVGFLAVNSTVYDTGTVTLTVNNVLAATTNYGADATPATIAAGLAAGVTVGSFVNITAVNDDLNLVAKQAGAGTNYTYSITGTSTDGFATASFPNPALSGSLDGGANPDTGPPVSIYSFNGVYDGVGNLTTGSDSVMGNWGFTYDSLNRLEAGNSSSGSYNSQHICWAYDSFGNRTAEILQTGACPLSESSVTPTATYNSANQVTSASGMGAASGYTFSATYGYDPAGDVTADTTNQYLYDAEGRLCAVANVKFGNSMIGYLYGADGARVAKGSISSMSCDPTINHFTTISDYILGPSNEQLTELDMDQNQGVMAWQHTNIWAAGKLLGTYDPDGTHFYLDDPLGTRRAQTDYAGVLEKTCQSLPYGNSESCPPTPTEHLFTGKERDAESGLDYFGARYYGSNMGRFMSPDWADKAEPVPYADLTNPQSLNLYSYAGNNPLSRSDADGHFWQELGNLLKYNHYVNNAGLEAALQGDADEARKNISGYTNLNVNGKSPADALKGLSNQQTVDLDRSLTNFFENNMMSSKGTQLGLVIASFGAEGLEARVVSGIEAANGTVITGFTEHGVDRAIGDAAAGTPGARAGTRPQAILDAIKNPTKVTSGVDSQGRPYQVFTGKDARVVVNPSSGRIVSVNPLSGAGAH